jgi:hypothetical protein
VTAAMRRLLAKAVADPGNTRFQFLDETSIPLYPPHLVWAQFMHETRTRMSACQVCVSLRSQVFVRRVCLGSSAALASQGAAFSYVTDSSQRHACTQLSAAMILTAFSCVSTCSRKSPGSSGCRSLRGLT